MTEHSSPLMSCVVKDKPEKGLSITTKPIPNNLADHEVLIKVMYTSICGTDYHIYEYNDWAKKRLKLPFTAGHEFCGEVIKIGDKVTVTIKHKENCSPKVLNAEVLKPTSTFTLASINVENDKELKWTTKGEAGSLPFIVEQYRWQ